MWKLLLQLAEDVRLQSRRSKDTAAEVPADPKLAIAFALEHIGRSLDLVTHLIREDAQTNGSPMVISRDRQTAADLLVTLLTDKAQRTAHAEFLTLTMPEFRHTEVPDATIIHYVSEQRWAQLSSELLGRLLLNPTAIAFLSKKLADERPAAWSDVLPAVRESKSAGGGAKRKPKRATKNGK